MPKESKSKALQRYRGLVDNAIRFRDTEGYDDLWWRMIDMYRGKQVVERTVEDRIAVNISFGTINVIYPSVSVNYPKITVAPNKPEDEDLAPIIEALINWQWKHFDFQSEFREAVKDWLVLGHGWLKVGYVYKESPVSLSDDEMEDEYETQRSTADEYAAEYPDMAAELPTDEEIREHLTDTQMVATTDQPFVERVSPFDIFVDPAATRLQDARWIAQRIVRPIAEVRADKEYNRKARMSVAGDRQSYTERDERAWRRKENLNNPEMQYATIWEFYDLGGQTTCVWAEGCDEYLVEIGRA